jgi:replicative DNA helicase
VAIDRLPPHSVEVEQAVLGCLLQAPAASVPEFLAMKPDRRWFYELRHQTIFDAITEMSDAGQPAEVILVSNHLEKTGKLQSVGGLPYLAELPGRSPTAMMLDFFAEELRNYAQKRGLLELSATIAAAAYDKPAGEALALASEGILKLTASQTEDEAGIREVIRGVIDDLESAMANRGKIQGLATGFYDLDKILQGLESGQMLVLAGSTSQGKTSLALNIAEHVAVDDGISTGIFSLEMSAKQLGLRLACSRARVPSDRAKSGELTQADMQALTVGNARIAASPLHIVDRGGLSIALVRHIARRMKQKHNIQFLILDYLQLLSGQRKENRTVEVGEISRGVKALAKELALPILALAQLNREPDRDGGREPRLSDLRESGSIEQDADVVMFIHRPKPDEPTVRLLVEKNRNGRTGAVNLYFNAPCTRFESVSPIEHDVK